MTRAEVIQDIRQLKYYYSRKKAFAGVIIPTVVSQKSAIYADCVSCAPIGFYDIYLLYVVEDYTQEMLAEYYGISIRSVERKCRRLYDYFVENLED